MSLERAMDSKESPQFGRVLIGVENLGFSTGDRRLFFGTNFMVRQGESVAVTGKNGTGKSVMLRILNGQQIPDQGTVKYFKNPRLSYVPQDLEDIDMQAEDSVRVLFYKPSGLLDLETRKDELESTMVAGDAGEKILNEYGDTLEEYERLGGYDAESRALEIMSGLGITDDKNRNINLNTRLGELSSGQRKKLLIGQALFGLPDVLIMDDPTTHLDVASIQWLSHYLKTTSQGSVIATNDVDLLNGFANKIVEITDIGRVIAFEGNYDQFTSKRDDLVAAEIKAAELKKDEIERLTETVERYRKWGNRSEDVARRRVVTERRVERMREEYEQLPGAQFKSDRPVRSQTFEFLRRSGQDVVKVDNVRKLYGDYEALDLSDLRLTVSFGERFSIFGRNGSGKSTLVRMIIGSQDGSFLPDQGNVTLGSGVELGYYSPDIELPTRSSIVTELKRDLDAAPTGKLRAVLEYWGFDSKTADKRLIASLSKGERTQILLAHLMLKMPNLLLLDEPTSNLSETMKMRLVDALRDYKGTLLVVSHDPDFVRHVKVGRELLLPEGKVILKK